MHDDHPVAQEHRFLDIVGDQHHRDAFPCPDALQFALQAAARECVQCAKRLVEQQHAGAVNQPSCDRHALRHAPRKLMRIGMLETAQTDQFDVLGDRPPLLRRIKARVAQRHADVLLDIQPGKQPMLLEHDAARETGAGNGLSIEPYRSIEFGV